MSGKLEDQAKWVQRVLGMTPSALAQSAGAGEAADLRVEVRERLKDVQIQASRLPEPAKTILIGAARKQLSVLDRTDPAEAAGLVDDLEEGLANATRAARTNEAAAASGTVAGYRRLQFAWRDAQDRARKQLDQFVAAVLADKKVQADEKFEEVKAAAAGVTRMMPEFGNDIETALGEMDDARDEAARKKARAAAQQVLESYSTKLDEAAGLQELQELSDDEFGGISFIGELQAALASLGAQIARAG